MSRDPKVQTGFTIESPIGHITLIGDGTVLTELHMARPGEARPARHDDDPLLRFVARQIEEYFAGRRLQFDVPLQMDGTVFRKRVWRALADIPFGETRTYGDIAHVVGSAPRAIGGACGANPIPIIVPCHRVIAAGGALGGFSGGAGCDTKRWLLAFEATGG